MPNGAIARWDRFWFREVPSDLFSLLRVVFGVMGLACVLGLTPVDMYWALDGIVPHPPGQAWRSGLAAAGLGRAAGWLLFLTLVGAFACMTVGFKSGWAVSVAFAASLIQILWNRLPLSGANSTLVAVLFCLTWAECSGWPSIDAWRAARRAAHRGIVTTLTTPLWPLRLIRIQVAVIYFSSGIWKLLGELWRDGRAIQYSLDLNGYHRFPHTIPTGYDWIATLSTYGTLFWEISFPLLMLFRWTRVAGLVMGLLLHSGIWATIELGPFSPVMMATYIAFLDPDWVAGRIRDWRTAPGRIEVAESIVPAQRLDL